MATMTVKNAAGGDETVEKPLAPGSAAAAASRPVALSTEDVARVGIITETAPASDTASSGLNGRLQRIAQRVTSLIALVPASLGSKAAASSFAVTDSTEDIARMGIITETAPASDTASSGLNGRLQRIAQNLTTLIGYSDAVETKLDSIITNSGGATPAGTNNIGDVDIVGGLVAHDGADSGNPIKIGGRARSSEIAAVASDDRADFVTDLTGKQIVLPYANPENFVSGAITSAMTGTTSTSLVAAPGAGLRNYITAIVVSNAHATVGTDVAIQDGSGGTTLMTIPAAAVYGGAVITLPVPLRQPTANTALYCANVTTGSSTKVSAVGYKGA
ncbi:hypothetical protein J1C56_02030 [Aminobacter anthyllidis]|uniref:Uncharacterized protein n=1 Tax=Aminobacter anthyllidis TaxID=1035067 RepID=A0A9X1A720_9HYPH|nr:hypothetical protein [Aminobacter anthyllidis]MBT1154363.1 hypothetical protein [Aminobacter anthyllidis]